MWFKLANFSISFLKINYKTARSSRRELIRFYDSTMNNVPKYDLLIFTFVISRYFSKSPFSHEAKKMLSSPF